MTFKGWRRTSLVEYPGKIATVVFTGGCQFRCPFCYNPDLVLRPETLPDIEPDLVIRYLSARKGRYQAVHITGGEPTLHAVGDFAARCRTLGLEVGLATNGASPERLSRLIESGVVTFVAMDVKTRLDRGPYARATGVDSPDLVDRVRASLELLHGSGILYELRTTVVDRLHSVEDIRALARQLRGAPRYVLQQFRPHTTLDASYAQAKSLSTAVLESLRDEIAPFFEHCEVRCDADS